jgi:hypothetical protein
MYHYHKLLDHKIKEDVTDGLYSTHVRDEKFMHSFGGKACREETAWEQAYE